MESPGTPHTRPGTNQPLYQAAEEQSASFAEQWITITKQEHIEQRSRENYLDALCSQYRTKIKTLEQDILFSLESSVDRYETDATI